MSAQRFGKTCWVTLLVLSLSICVPRAAAQSQPPPSLEISTKTLEDLVATIQDPSRRQQLLEQLNALLAAQRSTAEVPSTPDGLVGGLVGFFDRLSEDVRSTLLQLVQQLSQLPSHWLAGWNRLVQEPETRKAFLSDMASVAGIGIGSALAALFAWWLLRRPHALLAQAKDRGPFYRLWRLMLHGLLDLIPLGALLTAAFAGLAVVGPPPVARMLTLAIIWALALRRLVLILSEFLLAPTAPGMRLFPLSDLQAQALDSWVCRLAVLGVYGYFFLQCLAILGTPAALLQPLRSLYGLVLLLTGIAFVLTERSQVRAYLARRPAPDTKGSPWRAVLFSLLSIWWVVAIVYMAGLYLVWASGAQGDFGFILRATGLTALAVAVGVLLATGAHRLLARLAELGTALSARYPELQAPLPRYLAGARGVAQAVIIILVVTVALHGWGIKVLAMLSSPTAQSVLSATISILAVLLCAAAAIDITTVLTQRYLEARERAGNATGKLRTLVPLARKVIKAVVVVLAGITILSQAGVDIAPLLAGVGVLGLAIGFGAQTLVKDIITGVFLLLEDTIAVGDVVQVNGTGGLVEAINLRTLRLRDLSGNVHTIPYSSVETVTNMTKEYSRWLVEASVAYREDVDQVIAILQEIGDELQRDPAFGKDILKPIEILGLDRFEDSAVVVRALLTTKPLEQWRIGREFNRRMKKVFDQRGIEIPFPHRTIYWGQAKEGSAPPLWVRQHPPVTPDPSQEEKHPVSPEDS